MATGTDKGAFSPLSMKAPERTIAEAFPQYIGDQVIADITERAIERSLS
jgi:hypothetical protein